MQGGARLGRREFVVGGVSGAALLGMAGLPALSRADTEVEPARSAPESALVPLTRWLEETPRERLLEEAAARIRQGLPYRELLGALLIAGVRCVEPRPVGFKFHAVLAIHAAHQASQAAADADRWLPIFWSLDHFKGAQAEQSAASPWHLETVAAAALPAARQAPAAFRSAMERWDDEAAERAAASLARNLAAPEVFELFCPVAARDFRDIGHKVIYLAGAFRLLETIGWAHAEPVLRSLALALNYHAGENPAAGEQAADRAGRRNRERLGRIRRDWTRGKPDAGASRELHAGLRRASEDEAADQVVALLKARVAPDSIWAALFTSAGERVLRRPDLVAMHALTTANALRYCFGAAKRDETRRFLLLQAASFSAAFRGEPAEGVRLDELEPAAGAPGVEEIFADVARDNLAAARKLLAYRRAGGELAPIAATARQLVLAKASDPHAYKYSSAVLEDAPRLPPGARDRYLAAGLCALQGSSSPDSDLLPRIRAALAARA